MSDAITHFLVPLVLVRIVSLFYHLDKKLILVLSGLAIIPDIDFFVFWHRATFHNLFFGSFLVFIAVLTLKKFYSKTKIIVLGSFFFLSHLVLDNFFLAWFYPIQQFHYNLLNGKTTTLKAMNDARPNFSPEYEFLMVSVVILIYIILIYEAYFHKKNVKNA